MKGQDDVRATFTDMTERARRRLSPAIPCVVGAFRLYSPPRLVWDRIPNSRSISGVDDVASFFVTDVALSDHVVGLTRFARC